MGKDDGLQEHSAKKLKTQGSFSRASSSSADSGATLQTRNEPNQLRIFHLALEALTKEKGSGRQTRYKAAARKLEVPKDKAQHQEFLKQYLGKVVEKYNPDLIVLGEYHSTETPWQLNGVNYYVYSDQGSNKAGSQSKTSDMTLLVRKDSASKISRCRINFEDFKGEWLTSLNAKEHPNITNRKAYRAVITFLLLLKAQAKNSNFETEFSKQYIEPLQDRHKAVIAHREREKFGDFIDITFGNRNILFVHLPNEPTANAGRPALEEYLKGINDNFFDGKDPFYDLIIGDINLGAKSKALLAEKGVTLASSESSKNGWSHIGLIEDPATKICKNKRVIVKHPHPRNPGESAENLGLPIWAIKSDNQSDENYLLGDHEGMVMDVTSHTRQDASDYVLKKRVCKLLENLNLSLSRTDNVQNRGALNSHISSGKGERGTSTTSTATHKGCFAEFISNEIADLNGKQVKNLYEVLGTLKAELNKEFSTLDIKTLGYAGKYENGEITEITDAIKQQLNIK